MLKILLKNKKFQSEIKNFFGKNNEKIVDILLFGSTVKGKEKPEDIDIMLIFKSKIDRDLSYVLRKNLEKLKLNVEITSTTYSELFSSNFIARESFLFEAYSLINPNYLSKAFGFESMVLFKYDLSKLNKSQKMMFYYSLYGRNKSSGMLSELKAYKFLEGALIVPLLNYEPAKNYFQNWKIKYVEVNMLIPQRILNSSDFRKF